MPIDKIYVAKKLVTGAVSFGTLKIVRDMIALQVQPVTKIDKIIVTAASMALSAMIADKASEYTDAKIEEAVRELKEFLSEAKVVVAEPI